MLARNRRYIGLITALPLAVTMAAAHPAAAVPLAGTYMIGSGGDYATMSAAATALTTNGISAPVSFLIKTGTYSEATVLTAIAGANPVNRVRFVSQTGNAADVVLSFTAALSSGSDAVIQLNGAQYVSFDSLSVSATGTGSGGSLVWLSGTAKSNRLLGCSLNTVGPSRNGIRNSSGSADSFTVASCQMQAPLGSSTLILLLSGTGSTGISILNNTMTVGNNSSSAISIGTPTTACAIQGNTITMAGGGNGINFSSSGASFLVRGNRVTGASPAIGVNGGSGMIANNMAQGPASALTVSNATGVTIVYNSLLATGPSAAIVLTNGVAGSVTLEDNVIVCSAGAVPLTTPNGSAAVIASSDYNDLYTTGSIVATVGGTNYSSVSAWTSATGLDAHSMAVNPGFVSTTDLHASAPAVNNVGTPLGSVLDDIDGDVRSLTTPDIGADEFSTSLTPLAGSYTVGASGVYLTPAAAAADLCLRGVSAPVSFLLQSGTYNGTITLTPVSGANAVTRVRFVAQSGNAADVTLQAPALNSDGSDAVLRLDGARYVDVDSLTIFASSAAANSGSLAWLLNASRADRFQGGIFNSQGQTRIAVRSLGGNHDSLEIRNCQFILPQAFCSVLMLGGSSTYEGAVFQGNSAVCGSGSNGITLGGTATNVTIQGNTMTLSGNGSPLSVTAVANLTLRENRFMGANTAIDLENSGGLVANNMASGVGYALFLTFPANITVAFNTLTSTTTNAAMYVANSAAGKITLRNNILSAVGGGPALVLGSAAAAAIASSDYNDLYATGTPLVQISSTNYVTLAALRAGTGFETHSVNANPAFVSATDLHSTAPAVNNSGIPLGSVLTDIDGDVRSVSTPDIGADEFSTSLTPLAGTYTVGASGVYATPTAAAADVSLRGISAPVSFLIQSGSYVGTMTLTPVAGASAVNRVRFVAQSGNAADVTLQTPSLLSDGSDAPVRLDGARYIDLDSLTVLTTGVGGNSSVVWLGHAPMVDRIQGCVLSSTGQNHSGIRCSGGNPDSLVVTNCQFMLPQAFCYAIILLNAGTCEGAVISGNTMITSNALNNGFALNYTAANLSIIGNTISLGGSGTGLQMTGTTTAIIRGNKFVGGQNGISISTQGGLIANNFLQGSGYPLALSNPSTMTIAYNSLSATGGSSALYIIGSAPGTLTLRNNIMACPGGDVPVNLSAAGATAIASSDYNDFYTTGPAIAVRTSTNFPTLAAWQAATGFDAHSISANPGFVSATDLHPAAPALNNAGTPVGSVLDDIDGNLRSASTPDIGASEFNTSLTPLAGTFTVGASGVYATPTAAAIDVSQRGVSAPVSFLIQSGTYSSTMTLTPIAGANAVNRVRFVSQTGNAGDVLLQGASLLSDGSDAAVRLDGARYVDFDSLTIFANANGNSSSLVWLTHAALVDRFQACVFNSTGQSRSGLRCNAGNLDSMIVNNCQFVMPQSFCSAINFTNNGTIDGSAFTGNTMVETTTNQNSGFTINYSATNMTLQGNTISLDGGGTAIYLLGGTSVIVRSNRLVANASGLVVNSGGGLIANNMVQSSGVALSVINPVAMNVVFNSLSTNGINPSFSVQNGGVGALAMKDNILSNAGSGPGIHTTTAATVLATPDNNDYFSAGTNLASFGATNCPTVASIQAATGADVHSVNVAPAFTSTSDLHTSAPGLDGAGAPFAGVLDDFDGQLRNATTPDIGADEFTNGVTDNTPPNTSFTSGIADGGWTNVNSATFGWIGADDISLPATLRYETSLDGAAYSAPAFATSGTFNSLAEGAHSFAVVSIDQVGNIDPTPATRSFTVDLTAPDTQILTGPAESSTVSAANAIFTISGTDNLAPLPQLQYSYRVDGGSYSAPSTSTTINLTAQPLGAHTLDVRAQDLAGNADATPVTRHFTIAVVYDLTADWSDVANPNGAWSYLQGTTLLPHVAAWSVNGGDWLTPQPAWARFASGTSSLPALFKVSGTLNGAHDWQTGDFITHTLDPTNGIGSGPANVIWTNPGPATVTISGAAWMGRDIGRSNHWSLWLNGTQLTAGDVSSGDQYSRAAPMNFIAGTGGPSAIANLTLGAGDVIKLQMDKNGTSGDFIGVQMQVQTIPLTGIAPKPVLIAGPANGGWSGAATAFTWTLGAHTAPPSSITYATRVDGGLTSAFAPDTTLSLSALTAGAHTLWVIAKDNLNRRDSTTTSWTVDVVAPTVAFSGGPTEGAYSTASPTFIWTSNDNQTGLAQMRYAYSLDGGAFTALGLPTSVSLSSLTSGAHTLAVHSADLAGNLSTDALRHWNVDGIAPDTQILTGPANSSTVTTNSVTYGFTGTDDLTPTPNLLYQTRLDGGSWSAASSATSATLSNVADGAHVFDVRAQDSGGNVDATPASRSVTIDALGPVITITAGPASNACINTTSVTFNWSATDAVTPQGNILFAWQIDGGTLTAFGSTLSANPTGLTEGLHTFTIDAKDGSNNVSTLARTFRVDVTLPIVNAPTTHVTDASHIRVQCTATDLGGVTGFRVQVSSDPAFGSIAADVNISATGIYDFTGTPGLSYYARAQASDCAGNTTAFSGPSNVAILANLPNLVVSNVSAASTMTAGQVTSVQFTVADSGAGATSAPQWTDYIYLSPTPTFNVSTAIQLATRTNLTELGHAESYTNTASVTIPVGVSGTYYMLVVADGEKVVSETSKTDNTTASSAIAITLGGYADLHVISAIAPPTALSSDSITVTWKVRNDGTGRTNATQWYDTIFLSNDTVFDYTVLGAGTGSIRVLDQPLGQFQHTGALEKDSSYTVTARVKLPANFGGTRYVIPTADMFATTINQAITEQGAVFENGNDVSVLSSDSLVVTQEQPPDLTVDAVASADTGATGGSLAVTFTIGNHGFNATPSGFAWTDKVWLSNDALLDAGDVLLGSYPHTGVVPLSGNYVVTAGVPLPPALSGTFRLIVQTDAGNQLLEYLENNNTGLKATPLTIRQSPWANLVPAGESVSDTIPAGGTGTANWHVTNLGGTGANTTWTDRIEIGTSPTWSTGLTSVGSLRTAHTLNAGQSYEGSATITIPNTFAGTYYVFVNSDAGNEVFENTNEGDNVTLIGSLYVKPYPSVDLAVSGLTMPGSVVAGQPMYLSWTVTNQGVAPTLSSSWTEDVWLSLDGTFSGDDIQLASPGRSGALNPGAHYTRSVTAAPALGISGTYHVIVRSDPGGASHDGNLANNVVASVGTINISSPLAPQLTVANVSIPANLTSGQPGTVSFDVHNGGPGAVPNVTWFTAAYLSQDPWLDGTDFLLGTVAGPAGFASGATDHEQITAAMPAWASGAYYVIVVTDSRNEVWENGAENDNSATATTQLTLPPPADLVVQNVIVPGAAVPGQSITVSYTLANVGVNTALGQVQNAVYVSSDQIFASSDDPLVGVEVANINIPPGGVAHMTAHVIPTQPLQVDAQGNVTALLPPISPGNYYAIVAANIRQNIRELVTNNNSTISAGVVQTDLPALSLGVSTPFTLTSGQASFYKVTVPAGVDLNFSLGTNVSDATNGIFVAYGRTPREDDFDFTGPAGFSGSPSVLVPETQAGTYYVMVLARSLGAVATTENMTLIAQTLPFSLNSITPGVGGVDGRVTVRVFGAAFRDTTVFQLEQSGIARTIGTIVQFNNSTDVLVRFNLPGLTQGTFDFVARNGANSVILPGAFAVQPAKPIAVQVQTSNPDVLRKNATGSFTVRLSNTSNQDVPVVTARVLLPATSTLKSLAVDPGLKTTSQLVHSLTPVTGDVTVLHNLTTGDSLAAVDIIGANLAPGETRSVTLGVAGFNTSPYSLRVLAEGMTVSEFLNRRAADIEAARRALVASPVGLPDSLVSLANGPYTFRDEALRRTYEDSGIILDSDISILPGSGPTPQPTYPQPTGPQGLLTDIATNVPCVLAGPIPECKPDAITPGSALPACVTIFICDSPVPLGFFGGLIARIINSDVLGFETTTSADTRIVVPCDPNLMSGPAGFGAERWVGVATTMNYRVDFENLPGVGAAPAQVVKVSVPIDPSLDVTSFRLGDMGFGTHTIATGGFRTSYSGQATYADLGLAVRVTAGINPVTRLATWTFTTIDPATGQQPTNPYIGFLPVNDLFGSGTGFVTYVAQPSAAAASGSTVAAQATIQFDANTPLATVSASNRVDTRPPTSLVLTGIQVLDTTRVRVHWTDADDTTGAGLAGATLYMKTDTGTFTSIGSTTATGNQLDVPVARGHQYGFYTLAADNAGNAEPAKSSAEASVTISGSLLDTKPVLPNVTMLHPNYPNPFSGSTTIRFDLASESVVTLEVFDLQGRRVLKPIEAKSFTAGTHTIEIRSIPAGPGVYFYRFHAGAFEQTRRMVMLH